jgi:hypothetical protein
MKCFKFIAEYKREISILLMGQILIVGVMALSAYSMYGALGLAFYLVIGSLITGKLWFASFKSAAILIIWPLYEVYVLVICFKEVFFGVSKTEGSNK